MNELSQRPIWREIDPWRVSSELFLDVVMTSRCNCACPWCIARTKTYAEVSAFGQLVILKYAQVEDKYDRERDIPTLKLYPNGCLSNEWSFERDVRENMKDLRIIPVPS